MTLSESITEINQLLETHCPWLTTYRFASKAYVNDNLVYMIEKESKERYSVMPSDVRTPISYFVMQTGNTQSIRGSGGRSIQQFERFSYNLKQIFIINIDDVNDEDVTYFEDVIEMCREKILDVYINKQKGTGFSITRYVEDLENVFSDVNYEDYNTMRYPYLYIGLNLNVVAEVLCV